VYNGTHHLIFIPRGNVFTWGTSWGIEWRPTWRLGAGLNNLWRSFVEWTPERELQKERKNDADGFKGTGGGFLVGTVEGNSRG